MTSVFSWQKFISVTYYQDINTTELKRKPVSILTYKNTYVKYRAKKKKSQLTSLHADAPITSQLILSRNVTIF